MIVSFSVTNYRSFHAEETLSLVASDRVDAHEGHCVSIPGAAANRRVLRCAVLYGANASGKSNLFKAIEYLQQVAIGTRPKNAGMSREHFKLGVEVSPISEFDLVFISEGKTYRYGFSVDDKSVREEWLALVDGDAEQSLYERTTTESGTAVLMGSSVAEASDKVRALAGIGGPSNQSFLATIQATINEPEIKGDIGNVIRWFRDSLRLVLSDAPFPALIPLISEDEAFRAFAGGFLEAASTGIVELTAHRVPLTEHEALQYLKEPALAEFRIAARDHASEAAVQLQDGKWLLATDHGQIFLLDPRFVHRNAAGRSTGFDLRDESDGTVRLLNLLPALYRLRNHGSVFVIDEVDRSMHPMLARELLKFFFNSSAADASQLIITSHESSLLDLDVLRRDEIWFCEKDALGQSHLYSLDEYKPRKDSDLREHYLQGRFGAVPFLADIDRLGSGKVPG